MANTEDFVCPHGEKPFTEGRLRNFVFTLNNWNDGDLDALAEFKQVRYLLAGKEVGECGTPHLQGYCELFSACPFSTIKTYLPRAWLCYRKGSAKEASAYCKKDNDIYKEIGEMSAPGERNDIKEFTDALKKGVRIEEAARMFPLPFIKFHRGFEKLARMYIPDRDEVPEVIVYWGPAGCGKSALGRQGLHHPYVWSALQKEWFDCYYGQSDVLMEEFRGEIPFPTMLVILDRYNTRLPVKGDFTKFSAGRIHITSDRHPDQWYPGMRQHEWEQLVGRITKIVKVESSQYKRRKTTCVNYVTRWDGNVQTEEVDTLRSPPQESQGSS